jgi:broad specificity polyphosphatase/5'/3'-nucleotidase SurE
MPEPQIVSGLNSGGGIGSDYASSGGVAPEVPAQNNSWQNVADNTGNPYTGPTAAAP